MAVHSHAIQIMAYFVEFDHASGPEDNVTKIDYGQNKIRKLKTDTPSES